MKVKISRRYVLHLYKGLTASRGSSKFLVRLVGLPFMKPAAEFRPPVAFSRFYQII